MSAKITETICPVCKEKSITFDGDTAPKAEYTGDAKIFFRDKKKKPFEFDLVKFIFLSAAAAVLLIGIIIIFENI